MVMVVCRSRLTFFVPGKPVPKQSFRVGKRGGWQPKRVTDYRKRIVWIAKTVMAKSGWIKPNKQQPIGVTMAFCYQWPKSAPKYKAATTVLRTITPDVDNATKAILDGLSTAGLWEDDRQVAKLEVTKLTVPRGRAGVHVRVETLNDERVIGIIEKVHGKISEPSREPRTDK